MGITLDITSESIEETNLFPKSEIEEITQNISILLRTPKHSVCLDRELGVDMAFLDKPVNTAQALITVEIIDAIRKYEPRVQVLDVSYIQGTKAAAGTLMPKVKVRISDEYRPW